MKGRYYDEVPRGLEKIFATLQAYRPAGASGYHGSEDCMFIELKNGWVLTLAPEGADIKAQLSRNRQRYGDVETFALDKYTKIQEWLSFHGL